MNINITEPDSHAVKRNQRPEEDASPCERGKLEKGSSSNNDDWDARNEPRRDELKKSAIRDDGCTQSQTMRKSTGRCSLPEVMSGSIDPRMPTLLCLS